MQTELYSVSKLFTENLLRIPDYQRGYAWREKQIKEFWADLEQLEPGRYHYTGVLTLEETPPESVQRWDEDKWIVDAKHYSPYYVVDGQQRLTTIIILIQTLVERIGDDQQLNFSSGLEIRKKYIYESRDGGISRSYLFGYEKDNPSYEFLKSSILLHKSDNHATCEETIYTHNLHAAKQFFSEKIAGMEVDALERLYTKVTQHLLFNIYTIAKETDVFVVFETLNNRGKPLSNLELLKNRLIYLSTKFDEPPEERTRLRHVINESWKTIYHYLGRNKDRPLDDDLFLSMHHWLYYTPSLTDDSSARRMFWRPKGENYKEHLLDEVFTTRNLNGSADENSSVKLSVQYIYEYAHDIKAAVRRWYEISNPANSPFLAEEKILLEKLGRIAGQEDMLLLLAIYRSDQKPDERIQFLVIFERVVFLLGITTYFKDIEVQRSFRMAARLAKGKCTLIGLVEELTAFYTAALKAMDLGATIREWAKRGGYRWWGIRYFLFEYEQELKSRSLTHRDKLTWEEFARERFKEDYITIEHIYPQRAAADCWKTPFGGLTQREKNVLKHSLGNLVPLSKPKNSSLSNRCFADKKRNDGTTIGFAFGCYSENELAEHEEWTPREILRRGVVLLNFMEKRWGVSFGSNKSKVAALGLGFVLQEYPELKAELGFD